MRRGKTLAAISAGALLFLGLRPFAAADRAAATIVGILGWPNRLLAEGEVALLGRGVASSADRAMAAEESELDLRKRELAAAVAASAALQGRPGLAAGVVRHRVSESLLEIDVGSESGVAEGQPVTWADALVGVVERAEPRSAVVRTLGHRGVRLRGRVRGGASNGAVARLVVRGSGDGRMWIEVSEPRQIDEGLVIELAPEGGGARLDDAAGFTLGVTRADAEAARLAVVPDLATGPERLLQVIVRTREGRAIPVGGSPAESWETVAIFPAGDATPGRRSLLASPAALPWALPVQAASAPRGRVIAGAAVAFDGELIGRVARLGAGTLRIRTIEDVGFSVDAILLRADAQPIALGRVRTEKFERGVWTLALASSAPRLDEQVEGIVVTGNAERGVPKGLRLGRARHQQGRLVVVRDYACGAVRWGEVALEPEELP